jgi:hypothetical protein
MENAHSILVGKSQERRPLASHRSSWEDNIRIDLEEILRVRRRFF